LNCAVRLGSVSHAKLHNSDIGRSN
jgi:hypothetical protein